MEPSVNAWRREQRARLIALREALSPEERRLVAQAVADRLDRILVALGVTTIGLDWPIKHEINLLDWASAQAAQGRLRLCLPVVVTPKAPLEYWRWAPGEALVRGVWNIPTPAQRDVALPELLLAPLVGFDQAKYRLGNGGGYFDRTLASLPQRPVVIGIGHEFGALATIFPQPHDIPMDAVLTERRQMLPPDWSTDDR
jgi:5,10-methenyltetrahydrofolate synthetase